MPKQLFSAATCEECGGALNLSTLQCEYCRVSHFFDLSKAIPYLAAELPNDQYFPLRDRRVDSLLLFLIQQQFAAAGIEPALSLRTGQLDSTMTLMAKVALDNQWLVVGEIVFHAMNQHNCTIIPINRHHQGGSRTEIHWEVDLLSPGRFYFLNSWVSTSTFKGENELISSKELAGPIAEMVGTVVECGAARRKIAEERAREAARQPSLLARLFGVGD